MGLYRVLRIALLIGWFADSTVGEEIAEGRRLHSMGIKS
jgi:hypothetical protein